MLQTPVEWVFMGFHGDMGSYGNQAFGFRYLISFLHLSPALYIISRNFLYAKKPVGYDYSKQVFVSQDRTARTKPLLRLFDYRELPQVDQIISLYLRLDDAHRSQFMDMGNYLAEKGTSPGRLKKLKTLKK